MHRLEHARENLDAEQKKYSLGASTSTLVLQASSALTTAESNVLAAATNYEKARVQLDLFTADTLGKLGIDYGESESGKVQKMPKVPGIVPATAPEAAPVQATPPPGQVTTQPQQQPPQPPPQQPPQQQPQQ